jgi:hypothetical protein
VITYRSEAVRLSISARLIVIAATATGLAGCQMPPQTQTAANQTTPKHHHCEYVTGSHLCQTIGDEDAVVGSHDGGLNTHAGPVLGGGH